MATTFLAVDFDNSAAFPSQSATVATEFRRTVVEPSLVQRFKLQRSSLSSPTSWVDIDSVMDSQTVYIVCTGDGSEGVFPASPNSQILPPDSTITTDLQFRIVHILACSTAAVLGPQLVATWKAAAFIGYSGLYTFPDPSTSEAAAGFAQTFLNCDAQIDFALGGGGSVSAAIQAALNEFEAQAKLLDPVNPSLANMLRSNAQLLCGPTVDNEFGSSSATLALSLQLLSTNQ